MENGDSFPWDKVEAIWSSSLCKNV
jgi:hypothetical protein